mmetsp:Transcript_15095/g.40519  ORF Transcript_15095/g.40519 Transcript_15095/m.40519 type:complete len:116 (-) Transcript_15095:726-1073(-)
MGTRPAVGGPHPPMGIAALIGSDVNNTGRASRSGRASSSSTRARFRCLLFAGEHPAPDVRRRRRRARDFDVFFLQASVLIEEEMVEEEEMWRITLSSDVDDDDKGAPKLQSGGRE